MKDDGDPKADVLLAELSTAEQGGQAARYQEAGLALDATRPKVEARASAWPLIKRAKVTADKASAVDLDLEGQRDALQQEIVRLAEAGTSDQAGQKLTEFEQQVKAALDTHFQNGLTAATDPADVTPQQSQKIELARKKLRDLMPPSVTEMDPVEAKGALADLHAEIERVKQIIGKRNEGKGFKTNGITFSTLTNREGLSPAQNKAIDRAIEAELSKSDTDVSTIDFRAIAQAAVDRVQSVAKLEPTYRDGTAPSADVTQKYAEADTLTKRSRTMRNALYKLQGSTTNRFPIRIDPTMNGASCSRASADRGINISEDYATNCSPATLVQTIAHEAGHARYTPGNANAATTQAEWVDLTVRASLIDEAEATLFNCQVRQEILDAGGEDIGVAGQNSAAYIATYNDFRANNLTREQALDSIATSFGLGETTSTTGDNYDTYYRTWASGNAPGHLPP